MVGDISFQHMTGVISDLTLLWLLTNLTVDLVVHVLNTPISNYFEKISFFKTIIFTLSLTIHVGPFITYRSTACKGIFFIFHYSFLSFGILITWQSVYTILNGFFHSVEGDYFCFFNYPTISLWFGTTCHEKIDYSINWIYT